LALLASKTIPDTACTRCTSLCNCFQRASIVDWPIFNFFAKEPNFFTSSLSLCPYAEFK
jgi:hypothetical protein